MGCMKSICLSDWHTTRPADLPTCQSALLYELYSTYSSGAHAPTRMQTRAWRHLSQFKLSFGEGGTRPRLGQFPLAAEQNYSRFVLFVGCWLGALISRGDLFPSPAGLAGWVARLNGFIVETRNGSGNWNLG